MRRGAEPVERWTERASTPAEERAAEALRALRAEPALGEPDLARIQNRMTQALRPLRRHARWRWQPALVSLAVLSVAGIAAATIGAVVVQVRKRVIEPLPAEVREKPRRSKGRGPTIVRTTPEAPPVEEVAEPPIPEPAPAPKKESRVPAPRPVEEPPKAPAAAPSDGQEVRLFAAAMRAWRAGDARGALAGVEDYQNLYPDGQFMHEALVVKVGALQALGRSTEALAFLRYLSLDRLPRSAELHVIRGELAAKAGLCEEAVIDFDLVLKREPRGPVGARALYARASCRARLGDDGGAESDLRLYLLRHPVGAHVSEVRRALSR